MPDINIPCNDSVHRFNYNIILYSISLIAVLLNSIVFYISLKQKSRMKLYSRLIILNSGFNLILGVMYMIVEVRGTLRGKYFYYFTDSPFLRYSSPSVQKIALIIDFTLVYIAIRLSPIQFFYRYRILLQDNISSICVFGAFGALLLSVLITAFGYLFFIEDYSKEFDKVLEGVPGCDLEDLPTVTVIDTTNIVGVIHGYYTTSTAVLGCLIVVYYGAKTWLAMTKDPSKMTAKTKKLNRDMTIILVLQAVLPPFFLYVPVTVFHMNILPESIYPFIGLSTSFGVSVVPLLDALVVLLILPAFRQRLLGACGFKIKGRTQTSSTPVVSLVPRSSRGSAAISATQL